VVAWLSGAYKGFVTSSCHADQEADETTRRLTMALVPPKAIQAVQPGKPPAPAKAAQVVPGLYQVLASGVTGLETDPNRIGVLGRNTGDNAIGFLAGKDPIAGKDVGVYGESDQQGMMGRSSAGTGVLGSSVTGPGLVGNSGSGAGVVGYANSTGPGFLAYGYVSAADHSNAGSGGASPQTLSDYVAATPVLQALQNIASLIQANPGLAALFAGDVLATGTITTTDLVLSGADCAEEFDSKGDVEPGSVVVIDDNGALRASAQPYDKRVAGVVSGAGDFKPGVILDRRFSNRTRVPVALVGKVYCKVDAAHGPIAVGDLLTTSSTQGCAMRASSPMKAFGAILGKALQPCESGRGLIPILVMLR
jgi:hypothetical protein